MKVIFLDIDGVLTSCRTGWMNLDVYAVNYLHFICKNAPCKIVISSTWRQVQPKRFWDKIFLEHIHNDWRTPSLETQTQSGLYLAKSRGDEIQAWLDGHTEVTEYVILDDGETMLEHQKARYIQTCSMNGMLWEHFQKLKELFGIKDFFYKNEDRFYIKEDMFVGCEKQGDYIVRIGGHAIQKLKLDPESSSG